MESDSQQFFKQVYESLNQDLIKATLTSPLSSTMLSAYAYPYNIDHVVEEEMNRIKKHCSNKEMQYVEQMLLENPITIERRPNANHQQQQQIPQHSRAIVPQPASNNLPSQQKHQREQQIRADACRRSRFNNKVKKAKLKYRHKFISQKLMQSTQMFDTIQDLIAQAESHLADKGFSQEELRQLRHSYGMDESIAAISEFRNVMPAEN